MARPRASSKTGQPRAGELGIPRHGFAGSEYGRSMEHGVQSSSSSMARPEMRYLLQVCGDGLFGMVASLVQTPGRDETLERPTGSERTPRAPRHAACAHS